MQLGHVHSANIPNYIIINRHFSWQNFNVLLVICKRYQPTSPVLSLSLKTTFKNFETTFFQMA